MNTDQAVQDMEMITSAPILDSVPAVVLFNSGTTHTFIVYTLVPIIGIGLEYLGYDLAMTTPAEAILTNGESMRGVVVTI